MSAFEYSAFSADGKRTKGTLEGDSPAQIRRQLRSQGLTPENISELHAHSSKPDARRSGGRMRLGGLELALVIRQLGTLVKAGIPLDQALLTLSEQAESKRQQRLLQGLRTRIAEGFGLAAAMQSFPKAFPAMTIASVRVGEEAGRLDNVLEQLADYHMKRQSVQQRTTLALIYPFILTSFAILIVSGLMAFIVPEIVQVFEHMDRAIPPPTAVLIAISHFIRDWGLWLLLGLAITTAGFEILRRRTALRFVVDRVMLTMPFIGNTLKKHHAARFSRTLAILGHSGVSILSALEISAQVITNSIMRQAVEQAAQRVKEGAPLAPSLERSDYFPALTIKLIASGEGSGSLSDMLERAADQLEVELDSRTELMLKLFEPALILFMGMAVLAIVVAMLLPVLELNQLIQ